MLAGISADYYLRLERGRDRHPSRQVIDAVARVLQLDDEHSEHLRMLAEGSPRASRRRPDGEIPPTSAVRLVDSLGQPAYIEGRYFDILASNPPARAFNPRLAVGGNQLRDLFLDPAERSLHREWDGAAICLVSSLRQEMGNDIDDPGYARLVGELSQESPRFRDLWARHEVGAQRGAPLRIDHPQLGELTVNRERLRISGADGLTLVVYSAEEGSAAAEKLALLASAAQPAASGTRW